MSKDPYIDHNNSMYPEEDLEEVDDESWQISYLDIITILLGFLIILLSVSHFSDRNSFSVSGLFKSDTEEAEFITTPINKIKRQMEVALLDEIGDDEIEIKRDLNDLLIRLKTDNLYLSGSATIQAESLGLLNKIVRAIQNNAYDDFEIEVEGHTDDVPINSPAYASNWELSTARATNLVKYFTGMGISEDRLKASGYADSRPLAPNVDEAGNPIPENRAKNRRVTLRLFYDTSEAIAQEADTTANETIAALDTGCRYSVQLGGFESFSNALNKAKEAITKSDMDFNITYNGRLFSVRTTTTSNLTEALSGHRALSERSGEKNLGLIHQCYTDATDRPKPVNFQIQLGAFGSQQNARSLASSLDDRLNITTDITNTSNGLYRVVSKPGNSLKKTLEEADILQRELGSKNFISFADLNSSPYEFQFQIQLGPFDSESAARDLSQRISSLMGISLTTKKLTNDELVVLTKKTSDWDQVQQLFSDLTYTSYDLQPVIYLLESRK